MYDIIITTVGILLGFMLIPQLKDVYINKVILNIWTCSLTALCLFILNVMYYCVGLYLSAIPFSGFVWLLMLYLSVKNKRLSK